VIEHRKKTGSILGFPGATNFDASKQVLEEECEILVPAALEGQITADNAGRIRAKIVGEGANGPVTFDADEILLERGILVLPDIYLNAGGVTVSYFEWLRNLSHVRFGRMNRRFETTSVSNLLTAVEALSGKTITDDEKRRLAHGATEEDLVNSGLEETMIQAYTEIRDIAKRRSIDLRTAAFVNAIDKIAKSYTEMGIWP
jgi:glutamate dehydrogenase (NAD(P)+)